MTELRYGYTLAEIQDIALYAARTSYGRSQSMRDRLRAAWSGVVEHLYSSPHWPTRDKLASAGRREVASDQRAAWHHYGVNDRQPYDGVESMTAYQRYWFLVAPYPPPDLAVTERLAVAQIMPLLPPREREVLAALAAHGTHQAAAGALGMNTKAFAAALSRARRKFLALWHEGEMPSRIWRIDRRINAHGEVERRSTAAQMRARQRSYARTRAAAKAADLAGVAS